MKVVAVEGAEAAIRDGEIDDEGMLHNSFEIAGEAIEAGRTGEEEEVDGQCAASGSRAIRKQPKRNRRPRLFTLTMQGMVRTQRAAPGQGRVPQDSHRNPCRFISCESLSGVRLPDRGHEGS